MKDTTSFGDKVKLVHPVKYKYELSYLWGKHSNDQTWKKLFYAYGTPERLGIINQEFGENAVGYYDQWGLDGHDGIDWYAQQNTCLYAMADGEVVGVNDPIDSDRYDVNKWGNIAVNCEQNGIYFQYILGHINDSFVKVGDKVRAHDLIGLSGNTGKYTTGAHLHTYFYETDRFWNRKYYSNGYHGGLDHESSFFQELTIPESTQFHDLKGYFQISGLRWWKKAEFLSATYYLKIEGVTRSQYFNYLLKH